MSEAVPSPPAGGGRLSELIRHDLPASLVVFLVAVPLSLGIALASNAPIMAGLIAAIIGGILVGMLAGAPYQVSGPAAGLVVVVFGLTEALGGDWRAVCAITALAGVVQLTLGALRVARVALAISPAVVHGMLAGIGVLIALGQLHVVLGGRPQSSAIANLRDLPQQIRDLHGGATALGLLTIAILVVWSWVPARLRRVPAPLLAVVAVTLLAVFTGADVERINLRGDDHTHAVQAGQQLADAQLAGAQGAALRAPGHGGDGGHLLAAIQFPRWPGELGAWGLINAVLALALIASVESLLCAVATDKLHGRERADLDRELLAQGAGNTVSGLLGGLPITGVIVRSSANITSGARSRWSAVMHGVWVLVFVALLPFLLEAIPKSVLAGLLVFVGVRLVNLHHVRELRQHKELPIYLITVAGVVGIDLLSGVAIGFGCAMLRLLWGLARVQVEVVAGDPCRVTVRGALSFLGVPRLQSGLAKVPAGSRVELDLVLTSLDHAGWEALDGWRSQHERGGGTVRLEGLPEVFHAAAVPAAEPAPLVSSAREGSQQLEVVHDR